MAKIKMLHIQLLPLLSGVQNFMIQLLSGLDPDKYDIYIISRGDGPLVQRVVSLGWTHISVNSLVRNFSILDWKAAFDIWRIIRKLKPDIVHTHSSKTGFLGRIIARVSGVKLVIHTIHGFPFHCFQNKVIWTFYIILETFAAMFAHYNICVNTFERDFAIQKLNFNPKKTLTIYNAITLHPQPKVFNDTQILRVISVHRFEKQKNVVATIEQAINIVKKYDQVYFTFLGDGEFWEQCKQKVITSNTADKINLPGWDSNIIERLAQHDVFLLNSLYEGLSIAILEAMSVGLPIICSNIKGNNELVDEINGWLLNPISTNDLENVVVEILKNQNMLAEKGSNSYKKVANIFNYDTFISEYQKIYHKVTESAS
jgi:glycosyltransferase involved in cell wall biosynthesis